MYQVARPLGFIIGQAPPKTEAERPFGRTKLYKWFAEAGFDDVAMAQHFDYGALVDVFPGSGSKGHLQPTVEDIRAFQPSLITQIRQQKYRVIIPVGKMAIGYVLGRPDHVELRETVGQRFECDLFGQAGLASVVIPLPHPSGASTWAYQSDNAVLLQNALQLIGDELRD